MGLPSQIYDSHTLSGPSGRTGALYSKYSKETIQSYQRSISNSSIRGNTPKDLSGEGPFLVVNSSIVQDTSYHKSPVKQTSGFRNQSLSSIHVSDSNSSFIASPPPRQSLSLNLSSLEDEDKDKDESSPAPRSSHASTLIANPRPHPHPRSADAVSFTFESLLPPADSKSIVSCSRSGTVTAKGKKGMLSSMADNSNKQLKIGAPYNPVRLSQVEFNPSTGKMTGVPKHILKEGEKKTVDKINDAEEVKRLQQVCKGVNPRRLYYNLVKIGQG